TGPRPGRPTSGPSRSPRTMPTPGPCSSSSTPATADKGEASLAPTTKVGGQSLFGAGGAGVAGHVGGGLGPAADLELGEDGRDVVLDRLLGQLEADPDLAVGVALGDHRQDPLLLRRQP